MESEYSRLNIKKFLQWTQQYFGFWTLICTPNHEHLTPSNLIDLIQKLSAADLDEMIFVMLTVHRDTPFVSKFYRTMLFDMLAEHWEEERDQLINKMIEHLQ